MALYTQKNGTKREVAALYTCQSGRCREVSACYTRAGGAVKTVFSSGRMLHDYAVGELVPIGENGTLVPYRVWEQRYHGRSNTLLVREHALPTASVFHDSAEKRYEGSRVDRYLTEEFFQTLSADVQNSIQTVELPVLSGPSFETVLAVPRRVFLLSKEELGGEASDGLRDGAELSYYRQQAALLGAYAPRYCTTADGARCPWWTRTPFPYTSAEQLYVTFLETYGMFMGRNPQMTAYIRPAFAVHAMFVPQMQ